MWVGTFSGGINFANKDANKFVSLPAYLFPSSLNNNSVLSILEDSKKIMDRNRWGG